MVVSHDMSMQPWSIHCPPGVDPSAIDLLEQRSLPRAWRSEWGLNPSAVPIRVWGGEDLRASELDERSACVAGRLIGAGLKPGDRVLISASTSPAFVVAYCGILRAGLVALPMNTAYQQREVEYLLADARPRLAILEDEDTRAGYVRAAGVDVVTPEVELPDADEAPGLDGSEPDDLAAICYTSGTTGKPKGAMLTHGNLLASAQAVRIAWRWTRSDRLLLCLPLFHLHGLGVGINGSLLAGSTVILQKRFDPDEVLEAVGDATMFFGVPTMYRRLAASPRLANLSHLRLCVSGSAPLPADLHDEISRRSGQRLLERYGMTETLMNVSHAYDGERRPGYVGYPLPGVEIRLSGAEQGEIEVRGRNVFRGYWKNVPATHAAFTEDGWFRTGDIGRFGADGQLQIVGRQSDLIISGGYNIYPREVEDMLETFQGVTHAAVVGADSDLWGQEVMAYVVLSESVDLAALREYCSSQLAGYKQPKRICVVDDLPRNQLGKVLKHELPAVAVLAEG